MAADVPSEPRKLRRTTNACVACRQSKIKCSGDDPCANCQRRALSCHFVEGGNKVTVAQKYLQELQRQVRERPQSSPRTKRTADAAFRPETEAAPVAPGADELPSYQTIDHGRSVWTSPFTLPSRTIKNTYKNKRNWIWLAPTSVWSFTARLSLMMTEKLCMPSPYTVPNSLDCDVYPLRWRPAAFDDPPDISGLPSIDHALYLFNTVKFHLHQNYRFFEEETFLAHVHEFYFGAAAKKAAECRLWFVQFLLMLAFGNAFLQSRATQDPPGSKFFVRAMSLMPDHASLWKDSLLATEVLALASLYLYCIDHRESAHVYVGQAIRIAQMDGLHTELPEDELGVETVARCRHLWWTLYVMDRHFSSSVGLPMTTQDDDITTVIDPPSACSQRDATLSLHVKLSHLLSVILTSIYKTEKTALGTFLEKTRSILQTMAGHAQEIENIIHLKFQNSVDTMPRGTRHITLLYHQCVIFATRPLLLSVLKERLDKLGHEEEDWESFLAPTKTLISTGIKSAAKTLQILADEDSLLEVFLPFQLEFTYGAAILLLMATTLFPHAAEGQSYSTEAHAILDDMIYRGNRLATARKTELTHLEGLFRELGARIERRGLQTLTLASPDQNIGFFTHETGEDATLTDPATLTPSMVGDPDCSPSGLPPIASNLEFLENIGISSDEFLSIVNQIGNPVSHSVLDPGQARKSGY
ncbi:Zn(II)2Cys6 transcription factor [Aspergillus steynii IBT 23096]|uniref:Zn(II)2Cys6 transcription factor n=1 Tax=Aspergillus steynii IBT 23096 TaxID=1392250 RepID=A0A2I2GL38_9EURO|nr:Zn(II)2Cys6 transcription factor [Aspergillus steynii IBT 23096]PLB53595.1 Zn(II)2Cys6 transcription factor [Aspergillus steynii IBT 23096]